MTPVPLPRFRAKLHSFLELGIRLSKVTLPPKERLWKAKVKRALLAAIIKKKLRKFKIDSAKKYSLKNPMDEKNFHAKRKCFLQKIENFPSLLSILQREFCKQIFFD